MAQNNYFSLKGSIVSADSLAPIPQAHILSELQRDTIVLEEIDIIPYYNFSTVKEIVSTAPIEKPFIVKGVNDNIEDFLYQKPKEIPDDKGILSPIQTLYNRFNKKERLKRKV